MDSINNNNSHVLHIPKLDRQNKFVQMHPSGLGVNKLISHDHFQWNAFHAPPYFFLRNPSSHSQQQLLSKDFVGVVSNLDLAPTSPWSPFLESVYFDAKSRMTFVHLDGRDPALRSFEECFVAALDYIAKMNENNGCYNDNDAVVGNTICWLPPIVFLFEESQDILDTLLQAGLKHDHPPLLIYGEAGEIHTPIIVEDKTVVVTLVHDYDTVSHLRIEVAQNENGSIFSTSNSKSKTNPIIGSVNFTQFNVKELPMEYKDEEYVKDLLFLRSLADEAVENDPKVGTSGFMPMSREGSWRMCMGGECPIGNLFTDALRGNADIAFEGSGGLRGPGWSAGPVHVSDLWTALPFVNYRCAGIMSGVSVFQLLNHSTTVATFESTKTDFGDHLLQMSGMRMSYNTLVEGDTRLMSVDVWDEEVGDYLPLERLKLYKFATTSWVCNHFGLYPQLLGSNLQMEGEIPGTVDESEPLQEIVADYLNELAKLNITYDTSLRKSHVNDTQAFEPMAFIQTKDSCQLDYFWQSKKLSCLPCPAGKNVKFSDELIPFLITPDSGEFGGRNVLYNRELFNVTLAPKSAPSWVAFNESSNNNLMKGSTVLQPGESIAINFQVDVSDLAEGTTRSTVSFGIVIDGDYPGCLTDLDINFDALVELRSEENLNQIDSIRPAGWTLLAISAGLAVYFCAWTFKNRKHRILRASQPMFMYLICLGVFIMALTIIPLSIDDSIASPEGCSIACMAVPWLIAIGFSMTFTALLGKLWRIHKVMFAAQSMRRVVVHEREVLKPIGIILTLNLLLLLCWTFIDPVIWHRDMIDGDPTNSLGYCDSNGKAHLVFGSLLVLLNFCAIALACERAYRARKMGDDSYTESRWVGVAFLSWIQVLVIGLPVFLLTRYQPVASYFVQVAMVFLICVSMLLFMFLPKMRLMSKPPSVSQSSFRPGSPGSFGNGVGAGGGSGNRTGDLSRENVLKRRINELENLVAESKRDAIAQGKSSNATATAVDRQCSIATATTMDIQTSAESELAEPNVSQIHSKSAISFIDSMAQATEGESNTVQERIRFEH